MGALVSIAEMERRLASLRASRAAHEASAVAYTQTGDLAAADEHARTANALANDISRILEHIESWRLMS
jgi:hypothetical protein